MPTYAPADLMAVRTWLLARFDINKGLTRSADLDPAEVGIVGDAAHKATGGYHCGNNWLADVGRRDSDYSKRESSRDRPGTNAASALDIGDFASGGHTLRSLSVAIADACRRGDSRTRDIREVIYSPDGRTVKRWDRLGIRTTGGSDHTWHTHLSFHRDSEGRRDRDDNFLGLLKAIVAGSTGTASASSASTPQGAPDMPILFLVRLAGNATVRLCRDFMDNRVITSEKSLATTQSALKSNGVGNTVWEWPDTPEYRELLGVNIDSVDDPDTIAATLTDAQINALGLQIRQGVPSLDQIRGVVDTELDEQSRGGADNDSPVAG